MLINPEEREMSGIPVLRIELENMRETICIAFSERLAAQDVNVRAAVEAYCTSENLQLVIDAAVRQVLDKTIKEEVESFYRYQEGRALIKKLVRERLANGETELG
jgi:hypothetical protein